MTEPAKDPKTIKFPKPIVPSSLKDWLKQETLPIVPKVHLPRDHLKKKAK